jgi:hypothetical protein
VPPGARFGGGVVQVRVIHDKVKGTNRSTTRSRKEAKPREAFGQVARPRSGPRPGWVGRDAAQVHSPAQVLDKDEHIEATEEDGVDAEEVTGDNALRLVSASPPLPSASPSHTDSSSVVPPAVGAKPAASPAER